MTREKKKVFCHFQIFPGVSILRKCWTESHHPEEHLLRSEESLDLKDEKLEEWDKPRPLGGSGRTGRNRESWPDVKTRKKIESERHLQRSKAQAEETEEEYLRRPNRPSTAGLEGWPLPAGLDDLLLQTRREKEKLEK